MDSITLDLLLAASMAGGASCLTSFTELAPAAGPQASIAPAKFATKSGAANSDEGLYAYEQRYFDGVLRQAVLIDSKQSSILKIRVID